VHYFIDFLFIEDTLRAKDEKVKVLEKLNVRRKVHRSGKFLSVITADSSRIAVSDAGPRGTSRKLFLNKVGLVSLQSQICSAATLLLRRIGSRASAVPTLQSAVPGEFIVIERR
jgi:hypothetical protein